MPPNDRHLRSHPGALLRPLTAVERVQSLSVSIGRAATTMIPPRLDARSLRNLQSDLRVALRRREPNKAGTTKCNVERFAARPACAIDAQRRDLAGIATILRALSLARAQAIVLGREAPPECAYAAPSLDQGWLNFGAPSSLSVGRPRRRPGPLSGFRRWRRRARRPRTHRARCPRGGDPRRS